MDLRPFELDFDFGMDLLPDDFNAFTIFSLTWVDVAGVNHRSDGTHRSRLIADAAANTTSAAALSIAAGIGAVAGIAAGRYRYTISNPMRSASDYFAVAWPRSAGGSTGHLAFETDRFGFAKSTTQFEVEVVSQVGAGVNQDHVVLVFGPRGGEL